MAKMYSHKSSVQIPSTQVKKFMVYVPVTTVLKDEMRGLAETRGSQGLAGPSAYQRALGSVKDPVSKD